MHHGVPEWSKVESQRARETYVTKRDVGRDLSQGVSDEETRGSWHRGEETGDGRKGVRRRRRRDICM